MLQPLNTASLILVLTASVEKKIWKMNTEKCSRKTLFERFKWTNFFFWCQLVMLMPTHNGYISLYWTMYVATYFAISRSHTFFLCVLYIRVCLFVYLLYIMCFYINLSMLLRYFYRREKKTDYSQINQRVLISLPQI